ncbi:MULTISPECIES: hypothetical protein [unclassified Burkholderia]|uniref:hypothetical protein n=1 Tax=unclassified Burkholderia TaxID=2613784 RepID=UPI002AB25A8E|nr:MULTISPECIES: hypothetical protein [unclassified Burkholderia]
MKFHQIPATLPTSLPFIFNTCPPKLQRVLRTMPAAFEIRAIISPLRPTPYTTPFDRVCQNSMKIAASGGSILRGHQQLVHNAGFHASQKVRVHFEHGKLTITAT